MKTLRTCLPFVFILFNSLLKECGHIFRTGQIFDPNKKQTCRAKKKTQMWKILAFHPFRVEPEMDIPCLVKFKKIKWLYLNR